MAPDVVKMAEENMKWDVVAEARASVCVETDISVVSEGSGE